MPGPDKLDRSIEFLLAEFSAQQNQIIKLEDAKSNRVNFFLIVVAAALASISGIVQNANLFLIPLNAVLALLALVILVLGVATLNELVHYSEAIVSLYRRAGRVRRWFVDFNPEIAQHLAFDATDEKPNYDLESAYLAFRGGDSVILLTNSVAFGAFIMALISLILPTSVLLLLIAGMVSVLAAWFFQQNRLHARLRKVETVSKRDIHFPLSSTSSTPRPRKDEPAG